MSNAVGELKLISDKEEQCVFADGTRNISVTFSNSAEQNHDNQIHTRVFQSSAATAVLVYDRPWKKIVVPANETVLDFAALNFPAVNAETKFLVQWLQNTNVLGVTKVSVCPTNLFQSLMPFAGVTNFGVFDPNNCLKPLLKVQKIEFTDLGEMELEHFTGKLAIIGPFQSKLEMPEGLPKRIEAIDKKNVAVVWILPPMEKSEKLLPSFYSVQKSQTAIVVVQPELVANLADNPQSQLNLIYFCQQALNPQPMKLPDLSP